MKRFVTAIRIVKIFAEFQVGIAQKRFHVNMSCDRVGVSHPITPQRYALLVDYTNFSSFFIMVSTFGGLGGLGGLAPCVTRGVGSMQSPHVTQACNLCAVGVLPIQDREGLVQVSSLIIRSNLHDPQKLLDSVESINNQILYF